MNSLKTILSSTVRWGLVAASFAAAVTTHAELIIGKVPLSSQVTAKPLIMLAMGKDHRMFYEAYNDASDIDGDGAVDIRYKPGLKNGYSGLFDANLCYGHNDKDDGAGLFTPNGTATTARGTVPVILTPGGPVSTILTPGPLRTCPGNWSGDWLNYVTTARIDALRVVLYGGYREVDDATQTILRRAYIPQDAHSWAKEYTSETVDKYKITDYTPLAQPTANKRHFFGNLTPNAGINCATLKNCSDDIHPWLSVVTDSTIRVWQWASKERPVLDGSHGGTRKNLTVRVSVCTPTFKDPANCKKYGTGASAVYKPVGILHDFGENESALFGLMSGSYDKNFSGGRLRKVMSSFKTEVDENTGQFTAAATIVKTINNFRLRDFNNGNTENTYRGGFANVNRIAYEGERVDWGNPVGEIMYEAVRYLAGKGAATPAYAGSTTFDDEVGLPSAVWDKPYAPSNSPNSVSAAKAPWCARANMLTISDTNISYDSDQLPGVYSGFGAGITGDISAKSIPDGNPTSLNVQNVAQFIAANEPSVTGKKFIGQSGTVISTAPFPQEITSLGDIRGLAPEEPTKQGSYYAASVAHFAKVNDLQTTLQGNQTIDSFFVALASPLPRIEAKLPNGKVITIVPFAKSVDGGSISNAKGSFQPTNQIVDFYVETIANSGPSDKDNSVNGGRYQAKFNINYEDAEQGADHDMDAIVEYTVTANADNTLDVSLKATYEAGGISHRMGYVISGSTNDGIHLVVQDDLSTKPYFLNVPPGRTPGYCDVTPTPPADCNTLPNSKNAAFNTSTTKFTPSATPAATFLKDPMWYAAKWGGFIDANKNGRPDLTSEWDLDGNGVPDTYFFVQNPTDLRENLTKAFKSIVERNGSSSNLASNSSSLDNNTVVYRASYTAGKWSGDLKAYPVTANGLGNLEAWSARDSVPAWNTRKIHMGTTDGTVVDTRITAFSALPLASQTLLQNEDIYNYVRGDTRKEIDKGGAYRDRDGLLGDIISSSPTYDAEKNMLFIGANDGMLHAFDTSKGTETFAVIPREVLPKLKNLADTAYTNSHEYYVDGDVALGFRYSSLTNDTKYIYSLLGRGGKGLFSIKSTGDTPTMLWEYTLSANTSAAADKDLGLMLGQPTFAPLNNGKAALIAGNGYNSTDGKAVLYLFIVNPDGTLFEVKKIDTGVGSDNGLAGPAWVDENGDGIADSIFAGDLKGNLWKFDVSGASSASWNVALSGQPLFKAVDSAGKAQPITAPLYIKQNNLTGSTNASKFFIFFGTGSYFQAGDPTNLDVQSWYGIIDGTTSVSRNSTNLVERTISNTGTVAGTFVRVFSPHAATDMTGKRGWYIDLIGSPAVGERIVSRAKVITLAEPVLKVSSLYPITNDECVPGGDGYLNYVSPFTGGGIQTGFIDVNKDGKFDGNDSLSGKAVGSVRLGIGIPTTSIFVSSGNGSASSGGSGNSGALTPNGKAEPDRLCDGNGCTDTLDPVAKCSSGGLDIQNASDGTTSLAIKGCPSNFKGRVSWREILKD